MPSKTALRGAQAPTTQKKSTDESSRPHALSSGPPCCVCSRRARPPCAMFACPPGASSAPARGSGATGARPGARLRVPSPPRPRGSRGSAAARPSSASRPGPGSGAPKLCAACGPCELVFTAAFYPRSIPAQGARPPSACGLRARRVGAAGCARGAPSGSGSLRRARGAPPPPRFAGRWACAAAAAPGLGSGAARLRPR